MIIISVFGDVARGLVRKFVISFVYVSHRSERTRETQERLPLPESRRLVCL